LKKEQLPNPKPVAKTSASSSGDSNGAEVPISGNAVNMEKSDGMDIGNVDKNGKAQTADEKSGNTKRKRAEPEIRVSRAQVRFISVTIKTFSIYNAIKYT
jgi:hypothetical protein